MFGFEVGSIVICELALDRMFEFRLPIHRKVEGKGSSGTGPRGSGSGLSTDGMVEMTNTSQEVDST